MLSRSVPGSASGGRLALQEQQLEHAAQDLGARRAHARPDPLELGVSRDALLAPQLLLLRIVDRNSID